MQICLRNLSAHSIEVPTKAIVGKVALANQVPLAVLLTETPAKYICSPWKGWILEELNLQSLEEWPGVEQEWARELLFKWEQLFFCSDLDLGKTSLIKHWIELTGQVPFKEHHWHMSPHMHNDGKAHLQGMLDIGAIWKSNSLWASMVVLVWKKDGSLRSCIDLRKLNNQTVKDAFLLPYIEKALNNLQGS